MRGSLQLSDNLRSLCDRLATVLIEQAARRGRSLTYTELLPMIGFASEYGSPGRDLLTSQLLPQIGHECHRCSVPILSTLAVSAKTRKPEEWFRILMIDELKLVSLKNAEEWRRFVDLEQQRALSYWSKAPGWVA